jgi:hypothetical protein
MQFEAVGIMNDAIEDGVGQGRPADDIVPLTGMVDKHPLAGDMQLPHRRRQPPLPGSIEIAVAAVAVSIGMGAGRLQINASGCAWTAVDGDILSVCSYDVQSRVITSDKLA